MKILILHPDSTFRNHFANWIHRHTSHVATHDDIESFAASVAGHEPDMVFVAGNRLDEALFPNVGFYEIPVKPFKIDENDATLREFIAQAESTQRSRIPQSFGYSDETRMVFHDPRFEQFAGTKLHRAPQNADWQTRLQSEQNTLLGQIETALRQNRHEQAKAYLTTLRQFDQGLQLEMAYRLSHGSYKISELREVLGRWLTVMAHYLGSVDIERCGGPQNASAVIGFIHYSMPPAFQYPFREVLKVGINPAIKTRLIEAMEWAFTGESDEAIAEIGCRFMGLSSYLAEVAEAQIMTIETLLDPDSAFYKGTELSRLVHRRFGIFCEFWGLDILRESHGELQSLVSSTPRKVIPESNGQTPQ